MAQQHATFDDAIALVYRSKEKYPWGKWMDGEWWTARHGSSEDVAHNLADFSCKPTSFVSELRAKGRPAFKVKVRNGSDSGGSPVVAFKFYKV